MPENEKVRDFLAGILNDKLKAGKAVVVATSNMREDFTAAANYLSNIVVSLKTRARHIASFDRGGRFEHGGRGGRGGREGGRGRPSGLGGRERSKFVLKENYTNKEWYDMTNEQRQKAKDMCASQKLSKRNKEDCNVSFAETETEQEEEEKAGAGDQFFHRTHKKAKK